MAEKSLIYFLFVITCCLATQDNELLKNALDLIYRRQAETEPNVVFRSRSYPNENRYHSYFSDFEKDLYPNDSEGELTVPYEEYYPSTTFDSNKIYMDYDNDNFPDNEIPFESSEKKVVRRKPSVFRERVDHQYNFDNKPVPDMLSSNDDDSFQNEVNYEQLLQAYWNKYRAEKELTDRFENAEPYVAHKRKKAYAMYSHPNAILIKKRFPVSKRSSSYYGFKSVSHKRTIQPEDDTLKKSNKTDPKVVEDLTQIFGGDSKIDSKKSSSKKASSSLKKLNTKTMKVIDKEVVPPGTETGSKLHIKKKSVDWSTYFGIDRRRKKSGNNNSGKISDQWLMDQYKNTLQRFEADDSKENLKRKDEPQQLDHMRSKLKNIEDLIIDETLKYTGAHEGDVDTKEMQEVKDKVMARLTAAYNLEKMRHALDEYKKSMSEQRHFNKYGDSDDSVDNLDEIETNTSTGENAEANQVPEKKNVNLSTHEPKDDSTKDPCDLLDLIDRQCINIARKSGEDVIRPLCTMHQLCSICGADQLTENEIVHITNEKRNGAECNYMYLTENERVCGADFECRQKMNYSLSLLRGLRTPLSPEFCQQNGECIDKAITLAKHRIIHDEYVARRKKIT